MVKSYLLEKSRVIGLNKTERGYHIFYQILAGLGDEARKEAKLLDSPEQYEVLKSGWMPGEVYFDEERRSAGVDVLSCMFCQYIGGPSGSCNLTM